MWGSSSTGSPPMEDADAPKGAKGKAIASEALATAVAGNDAAAIERTLKQARTAGVMDMTLVRKAVLKLDELSTAAKKRARDEASVASSSKKVSTAITLKGGTAQPPRVIGYLRTNAHVDLYMRVEKRSFAAHSNVLAPASGFFQVQKTRAIERSDRCGPCSRGR